MDFENYMDFWMGRLLANVLGYATIIVPGYIAVHYIRKTGYLERAGSGVIPRIIRLFVEGSALSIKADSADGASEHPRETSPAPERSLTRQSLLLMYCASGLLTSYLIWGLLQERIMAYDYSESGTGRERFKNSQFLVFMNRILAFLVACAAVAARRSRSRQPPLYKYSYGSFSNIMSSWCQYEALKFVSFPVQVLAKAAKVIPVMLMGRLVSRRSYSWSDYVTAIAISAGLFAFLITSTDDNGDDGQGRASTTLSGLIILVGYLTFDSFTSNWQSELFRVYRVSSVEMMAGVNLFSVLLTSVSLVQQGAFNQAADFASRHPLFMAHVLALSITSAVGQLFIFYTISEFGAVTFTIIMTVRQGLAILLSCIVYHHSVSSIGIAGIVLLFAAIFSRMYLSQKKRKPPQPRVNASDTNAV